MESKDSFYQVILIVKMFCTIVKVKLFIFI